MVRTPYRICFHVFFFYISYPRFYVCRNFNSMWLYIFTDKSYRPVLWCYNTESAAIEEKKKEPKNVNLISHIPESSNVTIKPTRSFFSHSLVVFLLRSTITQIASLFPVSLIVINEQFNKLNSLQKRYSGTLHSLRYQFYSFFFLWWKTKSTIRLQLCLLFNKLSLRSHHHETHFSINLFVYSFSIAFLFFSSLSIHQNRIHIW